MSLTDYRPGVTLSAILTRLDPGLTHAEESEAEEAALAITIRTAA